MRAGVKPLVHLVCGSTGAGKTTFSRDLARREGGVLFSIDDWMVTLFGEDAPDALSPGWIAPRAQRCEDQMWGVITQLSARGIPAVLDLGFQRREHRLAISTRARKAGMPGQLHVLDVDADKRWRRVERRNADRGETFRMEITRDMFDYIETIWEPPTAQEARHF